MKMSFDDDFKNCIDHALRNQLPSEQLPALTERITEKMHDHFGGGRVYVRKQKLAQRNDEILANFTGNNTAQLGQQFGLSRAQIYRIIKK